MLNACYSGGSALFGHVSLWTSHRDTKSKTEWGGWGVQDDKEDKKTAKDRDLGGGGRVADKLKRHGFC